MIKFALALMLQQFGSAPIVSLEIGSAVKMGAHLKIQYHVRLKDERDPSHPAINDMRASAVFELENGRWVLHEIRDMRQALEFSELDSPTK